MNLQDYIGKTVTVTVDREMGSQHPKYDFIYPINYGYIKNTLSPDGEELDAYILGVFEPVKSFTGRVIALLIRRDDNDPKLIVAPDNKEFSDEAIIALTEFQERFFNAYIQRDMK